MVGGKSVDNSLIDQRKALDVYFDSLLADTSRQFENSKVSNGSKAVKVGSEQPIEDLAKLKDKAKIESCSRQRLCRMPDDFLAILFDIGDLRLATPLDDLSQTIDLPERYMGCVTRSVSVLGHLWNQQDLITLLNPAVLFKFASGKARVNSHYTKALIVRDSRWAIPCNAIASIVKLTREQIQWRSQPTNYVWWLGTEKTQLRSLIDLKCLTDVPNPT